MDKWEAMSSSHMVYIGGLCDGMAAGLQYLVCHSVCLSVRHAILAVRATKSITKDTIVLSVRFAAIKIAFFLELSYSKVRASLPTSAGAAIFS